MASSATSLVIEKYQNAEGDPSLAPAGNGLEFILRLSGIQFEAKNTGNPNRSPKGQLPFGYYGDRVFSDFLEIINLIHQQTSHIDSHLHESDMGRLKVFVESLFLQLHPLYIYSLWLDDEIFSNFTYQYAGSMHPFPLSIILPRLERSRIKTRMELIGLEDSTLAKQKATAYFTELSQCLGNSEFFFGEKLSSFDVLLYSYILSLRSPKLRTSILLESLESHQNLISLAEKYTRVFENAPIPIPVRLQLPANATDENIGSSKVEAGDEQSNKKSKYNKVFVGLTILALLIHNSTHLAEADYDIGDFADFGGDDDDDDDDDD